LGAHWRDNGVLVNADEAVKYPFKPADLDSAPDDELVWLWWETYRIKFCQPMGAFAEWLRQLNHAGQKVAMVNRPKGARLEIVARSKRTPPMDRQSGGSTENQILARTAPQFRFGPVAQPITLIANYTEHPKTSEGRLRLEIIRRWNAQAREWSRDNLSPSLRAMARTAPHIPAFNVHTHSPTVQRRNMA
jgi:hypothetical protein